MARNKELPHINKGFQGSWLFNSGTQQWIAFERIFMVSKMAVRIFVCRPNSFFTITDYIEVYYATS